MSNYVFIATSPLPYNVYSVKEYLIALMIVEKNTNISIQKLNVQNFKNLRNQFKKYMMIILMLCNKKVFELKEI